MPAAVAGPPKRTVLLIAIAVLGLLAAAGIAGFSRRDVEELRETAPPVKLRRSAKMARGWEIILKPGTPGEERVTSRIQSWYGHERGRIELSRTVVKTPTPELRMVGTAEANAINAPVLTRVASTRVMEATGYDPGPQTNGWQYAGTTKLGWRTRKGIVAVDPKVIPLRSLLYIEGYGLAWAGDVGGAIKGDKIDLCFNKTEDALTWGRRKVKVHLLQEVSSGRRPPTP